MINYREIFDMSYSYVGLVIIVILMILIFLLDKKKSFKVVGDSFGVASLVLILMCFIGGMFVNSFEYSNFIKVITDNFFNGIIIFSVISLLISGISYVFYKYVI